MVRNGCQHRHPCSDVETDRMIFNKGERDYAFVNPLLGFTLILLSLIAYAGNTYRVYLQRWDDAYITFRFADHLANGQGLVWNIGGDRVEGFTSPLHVLLLAAGTRAGLDPWWSSLWISVTCVLFAAAILLLLVWKQAGTIHPLVAILVGIYLIDPATAIHTTSGLETQLFIAVLFGALLLSVSFISSPRYSVSLGLGAIIFLSVLTRPEAVLYGIGLYVALAINCLSLMEAGRVKESLIKLGSSVALVAVLGVIYATWKLEYFGYLLPNPFYVKSNKFSFDGLVEVRKYITHLLQEIGPPVLVTVLAFTLNELGKSVNAGGVKNRLNEYATLLRQGDFKYKILTVLAPSLLVLAFYTTIIHEVGGAYRFSYPTYLFFVLTFASVIALLTSQIKLTKAVEYAVIIVALGWYGMLWMSLKSWVGPPLTDKAFNRYHLKIAKSLESTDLGANGTILCDAAGIIPYVSGFNLVERVGLVDNFLSGRTPATTNEREAYIWSRHLDVYLGADPPAMAQATSAEDDPRMRTRYVAEILLKRKLTLVESRIYPQDPETLHSRMRELRDNWQFMGEVGSPDWKSWKLKSFLYVRKDSPNASLLISKLEPLVTFQPEQVDLENLDLIYNSDDL